MSIDNNQVNLFHEKIFLWWKGNKRKLPWRENITPYKVLVSEFMLQQTQVSRVIPKFQSFVQNLQGLKELAACDTPSLLKYWSGLGYNRRALYLRSAAKAVLNDPTITLHPEELLKIKGIGDYTAHSIPIFTHNIDTVTIDTNIRKVLIHEGFANLEAKPRDLKKVALTLLPKGRSRDWHNALMDYAGQNLRNFKLLQKKQPKFLGSKREVRGNIIKHLLRVKSLNLDELKKRVGTNFMVVDQVIQDLVSEGFITKVGNQYQITK